MKDFFEDFSKNYLVDGLKKDDFTVDFKHLMKVRHLQSKIKSNFTYLENSARSIFAHQICESDFLTNEAKSSERFIDFYNRAMTIVDRIYNPQVKKLTNAEETVLRDVFRSLYDPQDSELKDLAEDTILRLLKKTSFPDICFEKKAQISDIFFTFFQRYDGDFNDFLNRSNKYLTKKYQSELQEGESCHGLDYVFKSPFFVEKLINNKPAVRDWDKSLTSALFFVLLTNKEFEKSIIPFIRVIETLPERDQKIQLDGAFKILKNKERFLVDRIEARNLLIFLNYARSRVFKNKVDGYIASMNFQTLFNVVGHMATADDMATLVPHLMNTTKGKKRLFHLAVDNGDNVIWFLLKEKKIEPELAKKIIHLAISTNHHGFLMQQKDIPLSSSFPALEELKAYFKDKPIQAIKFLKTFNQEKLTRAQEFKLISDFVSRKEYQTSFLLRHKVLNTWTRSSSVQEALSFFFHTTDENCLEPKLSVSKDQMMLIWTQPDENGATPWHYLCKNTSKVFFKRNFKILHPSFLAVCQLKDNQGKTPLDYARDNIKYAQYIVEKIPAVASVLSQNGISLDYVSTPKVKAEKKISQTRVPFELLPEKEVFPTLSWHIEYYGKDSEWKDPDFIQLIEREVADFPAPCTSEMRERQNREMKPETYGVAAFKTTWKNKAWRVPYITNGPTIYIFPSRSRDHAYDDEQERYIHKLALELKHKIAHQPVLPSGGPAGMGGQNIRN